MQFCSNGVTGTTTTFMWFFVHIGAIREQADCIGPSPRRHWAGGPSARHWEKLLQS
ncbi:Patatin [Ralstonia solanacearum]|nr:Patatin [Ralstonia solanacearum]